MDRVFTGFIDEKVNRECVFGDEELDDTAVSVQRRTIDFLAIDEYEQQAFDQNDYTVTQKPEWGGESFTAIAPIVVDQGGTVATAHFPLDGASWILSLQAVGQEAQSAQDELEELVAAALQ